MNFLFPVFLTALGALAIPVLIHLFNFRKFRRIPFTNVRFLQEIRRESDSRSRLRHWLILAARLLCLFFLVMAFAQPYRSSDTYVPSTEHDVLIYLDNSYSMGSLNSQGELLEQALEKARQIAGQYPLGTRFQLLTNEFKGEHRRWLARNDFLSLLDDVELAPAVRSLEEVLLRIRDVFEQEDLSARQAFLISDFQKSFTGDSVLPADTAFRISLVPVAGGQGANISIDSVWFLSPAHPAGGLERLVVRLRNHSDEAVDRMPLRLMVSGRQEAIGDLSLPSRGVQHDTLVFRSAGPGWKQGEVQLSDHPVSFDDHFYFSYRVAPELNVLLVRGNNAGRHLEALFGKDPFVKLQVFGEGRVDYGQISGSNLVILDGLSGISTGLGEQLRQFLAEGGSLAVFPAQDARIAEYNRFLRSAGAASYGTLSTQPNEVIRINLEQELFREVFERIPRNPDLPRVQRYFRLEESSRQQKESLLEMRGQDDLVARYASGRGALYLSAVPLREEASNLPRHALFVPLLYQMALLSAQHYPLSYTLGRDQLVQAGRLDMDERPSFRIRKEGFEAIPDIREGRTGPELYLADQVRESGNYFLADGQDSLLAAFSFNSDRSESELSYLDESSLEKLLPGAHSVLTAGEAASLEKTLAAENFGTPLWKYCVVLALIFLAAEVLLIRKWPSAQKISSK